VTQLATRLCCRDGLSSLFHNMDAAGDFVRRARQSFNIPRGTMVTSRSCLPHRQHSRAKETKMMNLLRMGGVFEVRNPSRGLPSRANCRFDSHGGKGRAGTSGPEMPESGRQPPAPPLIAPGILVHDAPIKAVTLNGNLLQSHTSEQSTSA
jgi:hypothetical protein